MSTGRAAMKRLIGIILQGINGRRVMIAIKAYWKSSA